MRFFWAVYEFCKRNGWGPFFWTIFVWGIPGWIDNAKSWRSLFDGLPTWWANMIWAIALALACLWTMFKIDWLLLHRKKKIPLLNFLTRDENASDAETYEALTRFALIRQLASEGEISVWGARNPEVVFLERIQSDYWIDGNIDELALYDLSHLVRAQTPSGANRWHNLHVTSGDLHKINKLKRSGAL